MAEYRTTTRLALRELFHEEWWKLRDSHSSLGEAQRKLEERHRTVMADLDRLCERENPRSEIELVQMYNERREQEISQR